MPILLPTVRLADYKPPPTSQAALHIAGRIGKAIARQVLIVATSIVGVIAERLWFPTAAAACICIVTGIIFWMNGMWLAASECAVFAVGLFAFMAALQVIARLCTWYRLGDDESWSG